MLGVVVDRILGPDLWLCVTSRGHSFYLFIAESYGFPNKQGISQVKPKVATIATLLVPLERD
jgi:hypothetical protein